MKKGSRFFNEFSEEVDHGAKEKRQGRSSDLIKQRNELLFYRYYYYGRLLHKKYELVLLELSRDFFITEYTIAKIIAVNSNRVKEIGAKKLTRWQLKKLYPLYNWNEKTTDIVVHIPEREVYQGYGEKK